MADDYDYDGDGFMDFDDGWLYVEDEFALAVRCASLSREGAASFQWTGTNSWPVLHCCHVVTKLRPERIC